MKRNRRRLGEPQSLQDVYEAIYKLARAKHPELPASPVDLEVDPRARTTARSFAFFRFPEKVRDPSKCLVALAPDLALDSGRSLAVTAHERKELTRRLAHIERLDGKGTVAAAGLPASAEQLADLLGSHVLGKQIGYCAATVQTVNPRDIVYQVRPEWLG